MRAAVFPPMIGERDPHVAQHDTDWASTVDGEALDTGRGACGVTLHAGGSITVADDGRGTDTRYDGDGSPVQPCQEAGHGHQGPALLRRLPASCAPR